MPTQTHSICYGFRGIPICVQRANKTKWKTCVMPETSDLRDVRNQFLVCDRRQTVITVHFHLKNSMRLSYTYVFSSSKCRIPTSLTNEVNNFIVSVTACRPLRSPFALVFDELKFFVSKRAHRRFIGQHSSELHPLPLQ